MFHRQKSSSALSSLLIIKIWQACQGWLLWILYWASDSHGFSRYQRQWNQGWCVQTDVSSREIYVGEEQAQEAEGLGLGANFLSSQLVTLGRQNL